MKRCIYHYTAECNGNLRDVTVSFKYGKKSLNFCDKHADLLDAGSHKVWNLNGTIKDVEAPSEPEHFYCCCRVYL